jgi:glyoxylase-like metal-dependent hydrolase (beta-lactamase superfamily II)
MGSEALDSAPTRAIEAKINPARRRGYFGFLQASLEHVDDTACVGRELAKSIECIALVIGHTPGSVVAFVKHDARAHCGVVSALSERAFVEFFSEFFAKFHVALSPRDHRAPST